MKKNREKYLDDVDARLDDLDTEISEFQEKQAGFHANAWIPLRPDVEPGPGWQHGSAT